MRKVDEPGFFDAVVVNAQLEEAYAQLKGARSCSLTRVTPAHACARIRMYTAEFISEHVLALTSTSEAKA
jgi:hypothetical protein